MSTNLEWFANLQHERRRDSVKSRRPLRPIPGRRGFARVVLASPYWLGVPLVCAFMVLVNMKASWAENDSWSAFAMFFDIVVGMGVACVVLYFLLSLWEWARKELR